jgi:hypothetical protein
MKPIFILCEGQHDTAFFGLLLRAAGAKKFKSLLADYEPVALRNLLVTRYKQRDVEGGRCRTSGGIVTDSPPFLDSVYELDDPPRLLLFFRCEGEHNETTRAFLSDIVTLAVPGAPDVGLHTFGILFVRDADDEGIEAKVATLKHEFGNVLRPVLPGIETLTANEPSKVIREAGISVGACIWCAPEQTKGTLEDILWPLLEPLIPDRLNQAKDYVQVHGVAGTKVAGGKNPTANRQKAAINIAGQVDAPGASLSVVLREMRTITNAAILGDAVCVRLTGMLTAM